MNTQPKPRSGARTAAVVILAIIVLIAVVYFVYPQLVQRTPAVEYPNVTVSGSVNTVGLGTSPISITFISGSGASSTAAVSNKYYSITLPNGQDYSVTVTYKGVLGLTTGTCNGGSLNLNVQASSDSYSTSC